jgi:hypothetical protein
MQEAGNSSVASCHTHIGAILIIKDLMHGGWLDQSWSTTGRASNLIS